MLAIILGIIAVGAGIKAHSYLVRNRPGPQPALSLLTEPSPTRKVDYVPEWKKHELGDILLTPMKDDYAAVLVHAVMEGNFYNVRLLSDPSRHMHVHASLLFTKEEIDESNRTKN